MKVKIDPGIIAKAFSPDEENDYKDFLRLFISLNELEFPAKPILYLILDFPDSLIQKEYEKAVKALHRRGPRRRYQRWYEDLLSRNAMLASPTSLPSTHKTSLHGCQNYEFALIALAFQPVESERVIVAEACEHDIYGKIYFQETIQNYLNGALNIQILDLASARKLIKCGLLKDPIDAGNERAKLRKKMGLYLSDNDLRDLSFDLSIDYETLSADNKASRAREIIVYCERYGMIDKLIQKCRELRSNIEW